MTMSVVPERLPPTGGTSCAPVSLVTGIPVLLVAPLAQPPTISTAIPRAPTRRHFLLARSVGIVGFPLRLDRPADRNDRTGHQFRARKLALTLGGRQPSDHLVHRIASFDGPGGLG